MLRDSLEGLLELLAPPSCAGCGSPLATRAEAFCRACEPLLDPLTFFPPDASDRAAFNYGGPIAEAIVSLKYRGASHLAPPLASLLCASARSFAGRVDVVAVVPLHPRRLRERGYNQSALLARPLARTLGVRFRPGLLRRVRETATQVGADPSQRRKQLKSAFAASSAASGASVLLVDDVRTTGATLAEGRRALLAAGALRVWALALAQRDPAAE
jgi:ComF family protein